MKKLQDKFSIIGTSCIAVLCTLMFVSVLGADSKTPTPPFETTAISATSFVVTNTQSGAVTIFLVQADGTLKKGQTLQ